MRIGIDASRANKNIKTGVEWYSYYLLKGLAQIDQDNQYFLYTRTPLQADLKELPANFQQRLLNWTFPYLWTQLRLPLALPQDKLAVLFLPASGAPLFKMAPTVVTVHDLGFLRFPELYSAPARLYHQVSHWQAVKQADKIITISEFSKKDIINFFQVEEEKVAVIPLAVDQDIFYPLEEEEARRRLREKYGIESKYFLYVGRLEKKKNVSLLLKAWQIFSQNHPDYRLLLIGPGGYGGEQIFSLLEKLKGIIYLPYISRRDLAVFYSGATAFVFPSRFEGFGLPLLEAMACDCPVICSEAASLPEVGGKAVWYFSPDDEAKLAELMEMALDQSLRKKLIVAGRDRVKDFSWQKTAQLTLEVFKLFA